MSELIELDGGRFSGSGTIVRLGVALAALSGRDLKLSNIRARRPQPGLRPQHLTAVRAIAGLCRASLEGDSVGSRELVFRPGGPPAGGSYQWDIGTAGSTTMLTLAVLPVAAFADGPCAFRITGGLFQDFAPSALHLQHALLPLLRRMGLDAQVQVVRPGYVPAGGGVLEVQVEPVPGRLRPLSMSNLGGPLRLWGVSLSSRLRQRRVSQRMADSCLEALKQRDLEADISILYDDTATQPGAALAVFAEGEGVMVGADRAGAPGRSSESIGKYVAARLLEDLDSGATVDRHLADQLIIFAALAGGTSEFRMPLLTDHVQSNIWLVESILGARVRLVGQMLRVDGVGWQRG